MVGVFQRLLRPLLAASAAAVMTAPGGTFPAARGANDTISLRVLYQTPAGCPTLDRFLQQVMTRTRRARVAVGDESARTFHVHVQAGATGFSGALKAEVSAADGRFADVREVAGATCDEVAQALALTLALTIDPDALSAPPAVVAPPPVAATFPGSYQPSPWTAGLGWDITSRALPRPLSGPSLFVEWGATTPRPFRPAARLGVRYGFEAGAPDERMVGLDQLTATGQGCAGIHFLPRWTLAPCLGVSAGTLRARGRHLADPKTISVGWFDVGAHLRLEWGKRDAAGQLGAVGSPGFELEAGLFAPITRPHFEKDVTQEVVADTRAVGGSLALRVAFPFFSGSKSR